MNTLKCNNCGANLKTGENGLSVACEYCNAITSVNNFASKYQHAKNLIEKNSFIEANKTLNEIIKSDYSQARAWFLKSQLPILEQDSIVFEKVYINANSFARLKTKEDMSLYLSKCGLPYKSHSAFIKYFNSKDFLYEQQLSFIDKAIELANEHYTKKYQDEKEIIIKNSKSFKGKQRFIFAGIFSPSGVTTSVFTVVSGFF